MARKQQVCHFMAYFQTIYTCALFLAVIACQETIFTHGRQLKPTKRQEVSSIEGQKYIGNHGGSTKYSHQKPTRKENSTHVSAVADVHSAGNSGARKEETLQEQAPNQSRSFEESAKESVDDFRPTAPGSSPGVGHSFADHNVDIQPEALGDSSGVHHTAAGNTHHFQPMVQGHNPGAGHSLSNKHAKPKAQT